MRPDGREGLTMTSILEEASNLAREFMQLCHARRV